MAYDTVLNPISKTAAALALFAALTILPATAQAATPAFNCDRISNAAESTVCDSWYLAWLDRRMSHWYGKAMERARYFQQTRWLRHEQRAWLRERNSCGFDKRCISRAYRERTRLLRDYAKHV